MARWQGSRFPDRQRGSAFYGVVDCPELLASFSSGGNSSNAVPAQSQAAFEDKATGNWWGARERLKNRGVSFDAGLVLEGFEDLRGGLQTSDYIGASTFDLSLSLATEKSLHWQGGKFYVDLVDHAGQDPSALLVGDLQVFDKLNSAPYLQVFELWYQQRLAIHEMGEAHAGFAVYHPPGRSVP